MDYLSDVSYRALEDMTVVSKTCISDNPEEEVIAEMNAYLQEHEMTVEADCFGFDVPVSEALASQGIRGYEYWAKVVDSYKDKTVEVKRIPGYNYAVLTITDPFANPFERIPNGWKALILWLENNSVVCTAPRNAACLEKIFEKGGIIYMDLMIPVTML